MVRSSSTNEDGGSSSMAGVFTSVLDVTDWQGFVTAVDDVLASGRRAAVPDARMAVLVQPQLAPRWGGVLFGAEAVPGGAGGTLAVEARGVGPAAVVPGRGEHDAGQDGEAGLAGAGEVGCFGADERPVGRTRLGEIEKVGAAESGGRRLHSATVGPAACTPVADGLQAA